MSIHEHMEPFNRRPPYRLSDQAAALFEPLAQPAGDNTSLIDSIAALSMRFTRDRRGLCNRYLDEPALAAAYTAYFLPVNFSKVQLLLHELPTGWAKQDCLHVLDLGTGPGTAALAVRDWLAGQGDAQPTRLHVRAVDHSKAGLATAARLWDAYEQQSGSAGRGRLSTTNLELEALGPHAFPQVIAGESPYDLIILANSLNELFQSARAPLEKRVLLMERLLNVLKPDGTLMILEPALRSTARDLHHLRDRVLQQGSCSVYSPCLHEAACPALAKAGDWCHEERPWVPPSWIVDLDHELGFIKDALKFSYLLLRRDAQTIVPRSPDLYRMVSELRVMKGEKRAWLCNEAGRSEIGRLDRKRTGANADFDACHRGALVQIARIVKKDRMEAHSILGRIAEESPVRIVREA